MRNYFIMIVVFEGAETPTPNNGVAHFLTQLIELEIKARTKHGPSILDLKHI